MWCFDTTFFGDDDGLLTPRPRSFIFGTGVNGGGLQYPPHFRRDIASGTSGLAPFYLSLKRGLDVLLSLENADPARVGVAGLSGGGWQTIIISALDTLPWQPPTVFLMRHGANDTYTLRLASDVYPNQPNVRRYQVALDAALFDDPRWNVSEIGPFVLAIRP